MKKILSLITIATFAFLVACGPSAEEKQAAEKARQDSVDRANAAQMAADSTQRAMMEQARKDSMNNVMRMDSIAKAEEAAKSKKPAPKPKQTTQEKKTEEAKKVTGGRGH